MFPESFTFSIANWVNAWVDALVTNYGDVFRHISDTLLWAIVNLEGVLRATPWWLMLAIVGAVALARHTQGGDHGGDRRPVVPGGRGRPVGQTDADPGPDAGRHADLGADRHSAGHLVGAQQSPAVGADAAARHHANHAQLRVPDPGVDAVRPWARCRRFSPR